MGYTHYWKMNKRSNDIDWEAFQTDFKAAIDRLGIALAGFSEYGEPDTDPEFTNEHVAFNGIRDESCEIFLLQREPDSTFCKTARRNYDEVVKVALIIADHHFGMYDFHATSDGSPKEWESALRFVLKHFGYGDFPFDENDILTGFVAGYAERYIEDYRRIRSELRIAERETA